MCLNVQISESIMCCIACWGSAFIVYQVLVQVVVNICTSAWGYKGRAQMCSGLTMALCLCVAQPCYWVQTSLLLTQKKPIKVYNVHCN